MPLRAALRPFVAIALLAVLAAAAAALGCAAHRGNEPFSLVAMDDVQRMLSQPDVAVIDANPKDVFEKNHLPGARWYKSAAFAQVLPADKSTRLVFYCATPSWMASHDAAREAAKLGYEKLYVMPDGIFGWVKAGKPVAAGAE